MRQFAFIVLFCVTLGYGVIPSVSFASAPWYNASWPYRTQITIDHTKVASSTGAESYTNFPLLVNVTSTNLRFASSSGYVGNTDGSDIVFTAADGTTKLNHEIEKYSSSTGNLVAWVQMPNISTSSDTNLYLYYGNVGAANQQNVTGTWDPTYKAVWHFADASGNFKDSTANGNTGVAATTTHLVVGQIDGAAGFDGATSSVIAADNAGLRPTAQMTASIWANQSSLAVTKMLIDKYGSLQACWTIRVDSTSTTRLVSYIATSSNDASNFAQTPVGSWSTGWHYVVLRYYGAGAAASDRQQVYIDGVNQALTFTGIVPAALLTTTGPLAVGWQTGLSRDFNGTLDEVRFSNIAHSADWIATEYNNQATTSLLAYNTQENYQTSPTVQFSQATTTIGETSSSIAIVLALSATSTATSTATFSIAGNATSGIDYTLSSTTVTVLPGATTSSVTFTPLSDGVYGPTKTLTLTLTTTTNATIGVQATSTVTILEGGAPPVLQFAATSSSGAAATTTVPVTVVLAPTSSIPAAANYAVTGGTAVNGADFSLASGTATVAAGATSTSFNLQVNNVASTSARTIVITLSAPASSTLGANTTYTYTIAASTDAIPPAVAWVAPAQNVTVSGTVTLTASSTDNVNVASVAFYRGSFGGAFASSTLIGSSSAPSGTLFSIPWSTTSTTNGSTTLWALATDTSNNTSTATTTVNVENPPVITSPAVAVGATSTATVSWTTNANANSVVNYGLTAAYGSSTTSPTLTTTHAMLLTSLAVSSTYHYQISSTDGQGNAATTTDATFNTNPSLPVANAGQDQALTLPAHTITLTGSATDAGGTISSYAWSEIDLLGATILSPSSASTTVTDLAVGTYTFRLLVTDSNNVTSTDDMSTVMTSPSYVVGAPAKKIVILGSSTAAGTGASPVSDSWVNLYAAYLQTLNASNVVVNLAVGGYTTYQELPTGTLPPNGRPNPDTSHNITAAIAQNPNAIIVSLPTNDTADGYTLAETEANFATIAAAAAAAHIPIWVSTSQPRNLGTTGQNGLITLRDWINTTYGRHALDFWTTVANSDGSINTPYGYGDGIHLNNAGHQKLYNRVVDSGLIEELDDTQVPSVSIIAPAPGAMVQGTAVTVSASATDNYAMGSVQFILDGSNLGSAITATSSPNTYSYSWNTVTASNATHTLTAIATDVSGNATTSPGIVITVNNTLPVLQFAATSSSGAAATTTVPVTVVLAPTSSIPAAANYAVTGGTAVNGADFSLASGTATVAAGATSTSFNLQVNNVASTSARTIVITLSAPASSTLGANTTYTYTILLTATTSTAPQSFAAAPGNAQAALTWLAPSSNGGSNVTGYLVSDKLSASSTYAQATTTGATATSAVITGLTNGASYDFQIVAQNSVGTSSPATATNVVPFTVPNAPVIGTAIAGNAQATVTFTPGFNGGSQVLYYTAAANTGGVFATSTGSSSITVSGLTNNQAYSFTVTATNAAGTSASSSPSNTVTPLAAIPQILGVTSSTASTTAVIAWTTDLPADATVNYGLTAGYGSSTTNSVATTSHSIFLSGLAPLTTYHFKVLSSNGTVASSSDALFTTLSAGAPTASNVTTTGITAVGQMLTGHYTFFDPNNYSEGASTYRWLSATSTGGTYVPIGGAVNATRTLVAADAGTYLEFEATPVSTATAGAPVRSGPTAQIQGTTTIPNFLSIAASSVTDAAATITWTTDIAASSFVNYGMTVAYGASTAEVDTAPRVLSHGVALSGLSACTAYHVQAESTGYVGNTGTSTDIAFTTTGCIAPTPTSTSGSGEISVGVAASYAPSGFTPGAPTPVAVTLAPSTTGTGTATSPTNASLLAQLLSLYQSLQSLERTAGLTITPAPAELSSFSTYIFSRNLSLRDAGADVQELQKFLIAHAAGPAAQKLKVHGTTTVFGALTYNALVEFQKYAGITPASGYFGAKTRAWANAQ